MDRWKDTMFLLDAAGALVAPERCAACDARVPFRTVFCSACAATLTSTSTEHRDGPQALHPLASLHAPFLYGGAISAAVTRFKYEGRSELARPLAHLLLRAGPQLTSLAIDCVVPVPLHPTRLVERGFNQAALLGRLLARRLGAAFEPRALTRIKATEAQATLSREGRLRNVRGAFEARQADWLANRRVLLVDDVATTGATLAEAAIAVHAAKAHIVHAVVLARA
ncbi:ComF family protein [Pendulispora rubella]|uniref:ComF family protein n=1 Tax=Pendulispora rubella TaxID=2741070 RepID=A0ABZ2L0V5_9BACT